MFNIVMPNYFPVLVLENYIVNMVRNTHLVAANNDGCYETEVYLNKNQTHSILVHSIK